MFTPAYDFVLRCSEPNEPEHRGKELLSDEEAAPTSTSKRRKVGIGRHSWDSLGSSCMGRGVLSYPELGSPDDGVAAQ